MNVNALSKLIGKKETIHPEYWRFIERLVGPLAVLLSVPVILFAENRLLTFLFFSCLMAWNLALVEVAKRRRIKRQTLFHFFRIVGNNFLLFWIFSASGHAGSAWLALVPDLIGNTFLFPQPILYVFVFSLYAANLFLLSDLFPGGDEGWIVFAMMVGVGYAFWYVRVFLKNKVRIAETAVRVRSAFLSQMTHEIRTPLNGIIGMVDVIAEEVADRKMRASLEVVQDSSKGLMRLLDNVLDYAKIEGESLDLEYAPFCPRTVVAETVKSWSAAAEQKGIELIVRGDSPVPDSLMGDPLRIKQVLTNLIENAVKFTEQGRILVGMEAWPGSAGDSTVLRYFVEDTGIGIPVERQEEIFQEFFQLDAGATRQYGGAGLGLTICRHLVRLMNGRLSCKPGAGGGTIFQFELELYRENPVPPRTAEQGKEGLAASSVARGKDSGCEDSVRPETAENVQERRSQMSAENTLPGVLVVEDNAVNQLVLGRMLEHLGYAVDIAEDGYGALDLARENRYALVFMDIEMPGMNGIETTQELRKIWNSKNNPPVIALTANAMPGDSERFMAAGMDGYLAKPVTVSVMEQALKRWLG